MVSRRNKGQFCVPIMIQPLQVSTAPTTWQSIPGVILRTIYIYLINITQLLQSGVSTQGITQASLDHEIVPAELGPIKFYVHGLGKPD